MLIRRGVSLCPICLRRIDLRYELVEENVDQASNWDEVVVLKKNCPEHGDFVTPIWRRGGLRDLPFFREWTRPKTPSRPERPETPFARGCPFDCGLCPHHGQHTCTALIEVTRNCNLSCPVCYADAGPKKEKNKDPSTATLRALIQKTRTVAGPCTLQFSGGEPTVRDDLPDLLSCASKLGFALVQLNTNGLRLAEEQGYALQLKRAGLDSVYLQYDGVSGESIRRLRGRNLLSLKERAVQAALSAGLGVVLVATIVRGVNDHELGDLLRQSLSFGLNLRGLHLQPASFFGRFPYELRHAPRLTLVEVMEALARQAPELVKASDFHPPSCEHELCSFSCVYRRTEEGGKTALVSLNQEAPCCEASNPPPTALEGALRSRAHTSLHWKAVAKDEEGRGDKQKKAYDAFASFIREQGLKSRFTISAMAFQDCLSLDLARVRGCCIHVMQADGRRVPFCLHNMTSENGVRLFSQLREG